jgi:DNA-binding transcriptional regulator LsrR (DeoR family)
MNHVQSKTKVPAGHEKLMTQKELGDRIGCSSQHAGRLLINGAIRPSITTHDCRAFSTKELDALRRHAVATIAERCSRLSDSERAELAAGLVGVRLDEDKPSARLRVSLSAGGLY